MKILVIDGHDIRTKEDFYNRIKKELSFPDYFGNNLDALHDVLTESPDELQVEFINYEELRAHLGSFFCSQLIRLLQDTEVSTVIKQDEQQREEL